MGPIDECQISPSCFRNKNCPHQVCITVAIVIIIGLTITLAVMASKKLHRLMGIGQAEYDVPDHVTSAYYRYSAVATSAKECSRVGT